MSKKKEEYADEILELAHGYASLLTKDEAIEFYEDLAFDLRTASEALKTEKKQ